MTMWLVGQQTGDGQADVGLVGLTGWRLTGRYGDSWWTYRSWSDR